MNSQRGGTRLHGLFDQGRIHDVRVLPHQSEDGVDQQLERGLLLFGDPGRQRRRSGGAAGGEIFVVRELVAVLDQKTRGGVLGGQPDHILAVLLELGDERREVAVPRDDHERPDMLLAVTEVHGVDAEADIGRVLSGLGPLGDVDDLKRRVVQLLLELRESAPVAIGLFDDDLTLFDEPLQDPVDLELVSRSYLSQSRRARFSKSRKTAREFSLSATRREYHKGANPNRPESGPLDTGTGGRSGAPSGPRRPRRGTMPKSMRSAPSGEHSAIYGEDLVRQRPNQDIPVMDDALRVVAL
jgi:hypothetical protein